MDFTVKVMRLRSADADIPLPSYMTEHASGMDIRAAVASEIIIEPGRIALIPTGFAMEIEPGYEAQIRPRSGLAAKHGIGLINSPGTIDADYRGEVMLPMINLGEKPFTVCRGDRIAQMVFQRVCRARLVPARKLEESPRGAGGFGHTGI